MNHLKGIHHNLRFNLKAYPSNPTRLFVNLSFLFFLSSIGLAQSPRAHSPETKSSVFAFHSNFGLIETLSPTGQDRNVPPPALNQPVRQSERRDAEVTGELDDVLSEEEIMQILFGEEEEETNNEMDIPLEMARQVEWIPSFSAKLGLGYSDNPMYGPYVREDSGYLEMESEAFLIRQGSPNFLSYLYLFGEGKRFDGLSSYDLSGILLAQAEHTYVTDDSLNSFGLRLRYTYYDQAFDFSDLGLPFSMQVRSNKSEVIPHFSHRLSDTTTAKIEVSGGSEKFDDPSENNRDRQIKASLKWEALERLSLETKLSARRVDYKARLRREADGGIQPEGKLESEKLGVALSIEREFLSTWLESIELNLKVDQLEDNGGGYYDYEKMGAGLSHSMKWDRWLLHFDLGWNQFRYDRRILSNGERFERQSFTNHLQLTRVINENWNLYLKWNREEDLSNSRDYEYFSNFFSLGMSWEQ